MLSPAERVAFVDKLSRTGVAAVEAAAFVNAQLVPQMGGAAEIMSGIHRAEGVAYPVLVPNVRGFEAAATAGANVVALMASASESFSLNNVNSGVRESLDRALGIAAEARRRGLGVRAYLSCCLGCPFEGAISPVAVAELARALHEGGCEEIVLSDTIGTGTPGHLGAVLRLVLPHVPPEHLAVHLHDTYGQALANIHCALQHGIATIDSSAAGLGGCPFAGPGAAGNVATEDVVYMLDGLGIESGVDFGAVVEAGEYICARLGRPNASKAALSSRRREEGSCAPARGGARLPRGQADAPLWWPAFSDRAA